MSRPLVHTRVAEPGDLPVLLALIGELDGLGTRVERAISPTLSPDLNDRLLEAIDSPLCRVIVACSAGQPVGMAVLSVTRPDPLSDAEVVHLAHMVVSGSQRHHGIGHALIASAADFAAERHIDHVTTSVYSSLRDASRFYARAGFAPVGVHRVAPVAVLRRRMERDESMPLLGDAFRRRTRLIRPAPALRVRRSPLDSVPEPADS